MDAKATKPTMSPCVGEEELAEEKTLAWVPSRHKLTTADLVEGDVVDIEDEVEGLLQCSKLHLSKASPMRRTPTSVRSLLPAAAAAAVARVEVADIFWCLCFL